jgi:hypothetical protein
VQLHLGDGLACIEERDRLSGSSGGMTWGSFSKIVTDSSRWDQVLDHLQADQPTKDDDGCFVLREAVDCGSVWSIMQPSICDAVAYVRLDTTQVTCLTFLRHFVFRLSI